MIHPIFSTVLGHPELIADHVANYAALVREESAVAGRALVGRLVAGVLAAVSAMVALGLIGTAVMLGVLQGSFHWVLVLVPGVAVAVALVAALYAGRSSPSSKAFEEVRAQLDADVRALHLAGDRPHDH